MTRRVNIKQILADHKARRKLMVPCIQALQAREGIETTLEQAEKAYDAVQTEKSLGAFQDLLSTSISGVRWNPATQSVHPMYPESPCYYQAYSTCHLWEVRYWPDTGKYIVAMEGIIGHSNSLPRALKDIDRQIKSLQRRFNTHTSI